MIGKIGNNFFFAFNFNQYFGMRILEKNVSIYEIFLLMIVKNLIIWTFLG